MNYYLCYSKAAKLLTQRKGSGWTNWINHIKTLHHSEYLTLRVPATESILSHTYVQPVPTSNSKVQNAYKWVDWVCSGLRPFSFVEDEATRSYSNLSAISVKMLKKKMETLTFEAVSYTHLTLPTIYSV